MKIDDIILCKPVIVHAALDDMENEQKEQALRLLHGKEIINDGKIVPVSDLNQNSIYCSEAVIEYRKSLNLTDVAIRTIPVRVICEAANDLETLSDVSQLLFRLFLRNSRIQKLEKLSVPPVKVPPIIMLNEYIVLAERLEFLLDNNWCNNPDKVSYKNQGEEKAYVYKSLKDLGFTYDSFLLSSHKKGSKRALKSNIKFPKPIVLHKFLLNLEEEQQIQAANLLTGKSVINDGNIVPFEQINKNSIYGSEAVLEYMRSLGFTDNIAIRCVPVEAIYDLISDIETLRDVSKCLSDIEVTNSLLNFERFLAFPESYSENFVQGYIRLRENVEFLLDSNWCNVYVDDDEFIPRSLKDVGITVEDFVRLSQDAFKDVQIEKNRIIQSILRRHKLRNAD